MPDSHDFQTNPNRSVVYQIRIEGHLRPQWADWFEGLSITLEADGVTLLTGPTLDQAALYGVLKKVRNLGLPLLAVDRIEPGQAVAAEIKQ